MSNTLRIKRSAIAAKVPQLVDLSAGELGMNTTDGELYFGTGSNVYRVAKKIDVVSKTDNKLPLTAADIVSGSITTTASGANVLDSVPAGTSGLEYTIHGKSSSGLQMSKILIVFDGTVPHILDSGMISSAAAIFSVDAIVVNSAMQVIITTIDAVGVYKFTRTSFT
jgi:hypothetical protein